MNSTKTIAEAEGMQKISLNKIKKLFFKTRKPLSPYNEETHGDLIDFTVPKGYEEVERYWVDKPYACIIILFDRAHKIYKYQVVEPSLTSFEWSILERIYSDLQDILTLEDTSDNVDKMSVLTQKTLDLLWNYRVDLEESSIFKILYYLQRNYIGYSKINPLIKDPHIEDISCDGTEVPIYLYHRSYRDIQTNISFEEEELNSFVIKLCQLSGKQISIGEPIVNATMPDGSRLQATLGYEVTARGSSFTIRKFREDPFTPVDMIKMGTCNVEMMVYLWLGIENNKNMLFAGGTASGKTTMLNAVSLFLPPQAKVVSIEDTKELVLHNDNWVSALTRDSFMVGSLGEISMFELLKTAMRQRPEYLLVGEVRGEEALTLFQAMSTGHASYSTIHAGDLPDVVNRLESEPINVPHSMLQALDVLCLQTNTHYKNQRVRRTKQIVEITGLDPLTENIRINEIYRWNPIHDDFKRAGNSQVFNEIMQERGWTKEELENEIKNRKQILQYLVDQNIRNYVDFAQIIQEYSVNPDEILSRVQNNKGL